MVSFVDIGKSTENYSFINSQLIKLFYDRGTELHCTDCLRVTVGTREENDKFLSLLAAVAKELGLE